MFTGERKSKHTLSYRPGWPCCHKGLLYIPDIDSPSINVYTWSGELVTTFESDTLGLETTDHIYSISVFENGYFVIHRQNSETISYLRAQRLQPVKLPDTESGHASVKQICSITVSKWKGVIPGFHFASHRVLRWGYQSPRVAQYKLDNDIFVETEISAEVKQKWIEDVHKYIYLI